MTRRRLSFRDMVVLLGVVSLLGVAGVAHLQGSVVTSWRCRLAMEDVASTLRIMRYRAAREGRTYRLQIDQRGRRLELIADDPRPRHGGRLVRTLWLPEAFRVDQSPHAFVALPTGEFIPATLLTRVPERALFFRISTTAHGAVHLDEQPSS